MAVFCLLAKIAAKNQCAKRVLSGCFFSVIRWQGVISALAAEKILSKCRDEYEAVNAVKPQA
jgi:hypothetical protein